eukprot:bmy_06894T0
MAEKRDGEEWRLTTPTMLVSTAALISRGDFKEVLEGEEEGEKRGGGREREMLAGRSGRQEGQVGNEMPMARLAS